MQRARRSHASLVVSGAVIVAAAVLVAMVETSSLPRGSVWAVVAAAIVVVAIIRRLF